MNTREQVLELKARMSESIIGQESVIERILIALLSNGNLLLEGLPGLAKTRAIKSLAKNIEADFSRIQFTPDLLPSDVTGSEVYYSDNGKGTFQFQPGPIFGNLILADEINRAPAKVQSALLEAMEERQVTVAGKTHRMPELFMVLATQNPIEQEGTYPLPEAQRDRFLMHTLVDYPSDADEEKVMLLVRKEDTEAINEAGQDKESDATVQKDGAKRDRLPQSVIFDARREIQKVNMSESIQKYIVAIVAATRRPKDFSEKLAQWIHVGASPRCTLAFDRTSRAYAWLQGRDHVLPDDIRAMAKDCLRHRIILGYQAHADGITKDAVIDEVLSLVAIA